jgi:hypothetical protein|tara:strand:+ start:1410 stop:2690 length:1281 start_codon:yes stop_codon:yes gene_type:complete
LFFAPLSIDSQNNTSSPYSFYGIGSLDFKGTSESRAMGGISVYNDSIHMNFRNPASYTGKDMFSFNNEGRLVKFTVGLGHSETELKTSANNTETTNTSFEYLGLNIPMGKFGLGFGLIPYSSVGYKLQSSNNEDQPQYKYSGNGGLNKVFLGFAYQLNNNLSVGFDTKYNFGNIQNSALEYLYDDESLPLDYQAREQNRSDLSGVNFNFGIIYKGRFKDNLEIHGTFAFSPEYNLSSRNSRTFASVVINPNTELEYPVNEINVDLESIGLDKTDLSMPSKTNFGLGIGFPKKWFIGAEYTILTSSVFSNELINIENSEFEDSSKLSFGGFYIPDYASFSKFWNRVVYRAGFYSEKTGLVINNESINEFGISFGLGIPAGGLFSNVNTTIEFGKRGTTNANLVEEKFINFQLSLSLNDRWFIKRKYN